MSAALSAPPEVQLTKGWYRIGEVAAILGVAVHTLRHWEKELRLHPERSKKSQRNYTKKQVERLLWIRQLLYIERYTIEGARRRLRGHALTCPGCGCEMPRLESEND